MARYKRTISGLNEGKRNIKLDIKTWNILNNMKKQNETFNDLILYLLKERTDVKGNNNFNAIRYVRKTKFIEISYKDKVVGVEFDYNDLDKEQSNYVIDLKFKKIFMERKIFNPSEFFGVDNIRKHFNESFLNIYLKCVYFSLQKEFRILSNDFKTDSDFENIIIWRKIYFENYLSEESFINDIEDPLKQSEEKFDKEVKNNIKNSVSNLIWGLI